MDMELLTNAGTSANCMLGLSGFGIMTTGGLIDLRDEAKVGGLNCKVARRNNMFRAASRSVHVVDQAVLFGRLWTIPLAIIPTYRLPYGTISEDSYQKTIRCRNSEKY